MNDESGPRIVVRNVTMNPVKVSRWVVPPGQEIKDVPMSFGEAFLRRGCEIINPDGSITTPTGTTRDDHGALFAFSAVDTSIEYSDGISVVIPTYNRANTVVAAIESVLTQRYPDLEIVVVDDGSRDLTPSNIMALRDKAVAMQCLLTYVMTSRNMGISEARNLGVMVAKHDNIVLLDSDDKMAMGTLSRIAQSFSDKSIDVIYGGYIDGDGNKHSAPDWEPGRLANSGCYMLGVRAFRKRVWEMVGGFDETISTAEDLDILIRMEDIGAKFANIKSPLCIIGDMGDRITKHGSDEVNADACEVRGRSSIRRRPAWIPCA